MKDNMTDSEIERFGQLFDEKIKELSIMAQIPSTKKDAVLNKEILTKMYQDNLDILAPNQISAYEKTIAMLDALSKELDEAAIQAVEDAQYEMAPTPEVQNIRDNFDEKLSLAYITFSVIADKTQAQSDKDSLVRLYDKCSDYLTQAQKRSYQELIGKLDTYLGIDHTTEDVVVTDDAAQSATQKDTHTDTDLAIKVAKRLEELKENNQVVRAYDMPDREKKAFVAEALKRIKEKRAMDANADILGDVITLEGIYADYRYLLSTREIEEISSILKEPFTVEYKQIQLANGFVKKTLFFEIERMMSWGMKPNMQKWYEVEACVEKNKKVLSPQALQQYNEVKTALEAKGYLSTPTDDNLPSA